MRVRSLPVKSVIAALATLALVALLGSRLLASDPYTLTMLMPAADSTFVGSKVLVDGEQVGEVTDLGVRDGQAAVTIEVDDDHAPLPAGTKARIRWESVLGARVIELTPGDEDNVALPAGHLLTDNVEGVEIDDLLAMLDEPTRKQLQGLVTQLDGTLTGRTQDLNETLEHAGPTIKALGAVARAVGRDGPAIKKIVHQLHGVSATVAGRNDEVADSVAQLELLVQAVAAQQQDLSQLLTRLPGTLDHATTTLANVQAPVSSARTLLRDLRPSTERLPGIARDLRPVVAAARPALADLTPTLEDADALLRRTPALASGARDLLPTLDEAVEQLNPMVAFLRPYTPELVGWLTNWTSLFASQNASGNYARALITGSASSLDDVLPGVPPGQSQDPRPAPGSLAGQPWTDANGDPVQ
jgi:phospholipid/cholesterol/gamma-HCH transport system substrate-binding protein